MKAQEALERWLAGSTCLHHKRTVFWEQGDYYILKHWAHAEYCDRFSGTQNCGAYYDLYHVDAPPKGTFPKPIWKVEGRWKKAYFVEAEAAIARHYFQLQQQGSDAQG
tara:strand:- start:222 stop:545 length:324 start_codon:yes stop_codon:yes gene_type:complete